MAVSDFDAALLLDSSKSTIFNARGYAYANMRNYEKAITDYNKAIQLDSAFADAFSNRGFANSNMKLKDSAVKDWEKAIQLNANLEQSLRPYINDAKK
jgi:tetratricopeptide (TPR) repeat protein